MAKAKRKARKQFAIEPLDLPTPEQIRNGDFERVFTTHVNSNTKAATFKRRDGNIVEKWLREDPATFGEPARRVIGDCVSLWAQMGDPRITANYGERIAAGSDCDGYRADRARRRLEDMRQALGPYMRHYWVVWENVLRHNEPAGVAGSRFANNPPQRIQSAKVIVGMVANTLAGRLGY
jgi:hypothetical protein